MHHLLVNLYAVVEKSVWLNPSVNVQDHPDD